MASVYSYIKQTFTYCWIPCCEWSGHFTKIEDHFELCHPRKIRKIQQESYFQLTFYDLRSNTPLLLSTGKEYYWFLQSEKEHEPGYFARGIFVIGTSTPIQYHIKLGMFSTRIVEMLGPYLTQQDTAQENYDFIMHSDYMEYLSSTMPLNVVVFFGDFEDDADENPYKTIMLEKAFPTSSKYPENFICSSCERVVSGTIFYCKNHHFLCEECFEII